MPKISIYAQYHDVIIECIRDRMTCKQIISKLYEQCNISVKAGSLQKYIKAKCSEEYSDRKTEILLHAHKETIIDLLSKGYPMKRIIEHINNKLDKKITVSQLSYYLSKCSVSRVLIHDTSSDNKVYSILNSSLFFNIVYEDRIRTFTYSGITEMQLKAKMNLLLIYHKNTNIIISGSRLDVIHRELINNRLCELFAGHNRLLDNNTLLSIKEIIFTDESKTLLDSVNIYN